MNLYELSQMTEIQSRKYLENIRWPNGAVCPRCESKNVAKFNNSAYANRKRREGLYKCRDCCKQFSVTVVNIFGECLNIKTENTVSVWSRTSLYIYP